MTRALVAVDGSAPSIDAARRAVELLDPSTEFTVLHVVEPPVPGPGGRTADPVLVVVGTGGAGGIRRALLGSTSRHLVNDARRPLLVVGEGGEDGAT